MKLKVLLMHRKINYACLQRHIITKKKPLGKYEKNEPASNENKDELLCVRQRCRIV